MPNCTSKKEVQGDSNFLKGKKKNLKQPNAQCKRIGGGEKKRKPQSHYNKGNTKYQRGNKQKTKATTTKTVEDINEIKNWLFEKRKKKTISFQLHSSRRKRGLKQSMK